MDKTYCRKCKFGYIYTNTLCFPEDKNVGNEFTGEIMKYNAGITKTISNENGECKHYIEMGESK